MLREAAIDARSVSDAVVQGETALSATLRRRCAEAEERVRRSDFENAELRREVDALRQRVAQSGADHSQQGREPIKPGSLEAQTVAKVNSAALVEAQRAGKDAATRAEAEAGGMLSSSKKSSSLDDGPKAAGGTAAALSAAAAAGSSSDTLPRTEREAFKELCDANEDPETGKSLKTWTVASWLDSLRLADVLADVLLARLRNPHQVPSASSKDVASSPRNADGNAGAASGVGSPSIKAAATAAKAATAFGSSKGGGLSAVAAVGSGSAESSTPAVGGGAAVSGAAASIGAVGSGAGMAPAVERAFARQLGELGSRSTIVALLKEVPLAEMLAEVIWKGAERLAAEVRYTRATPSHTPLVHKYASDGLSALGFASAGARVVHGGLDALLGGVAGGVSDAYSRGGGGSALLAAVQSEHCERGDSRVRFFSPDYQINTTSEAEYWFVVAPERGLGHLGLSAWPQVKAYYLCHEPCTTRHAKRTPHTPNRRLTFHPVRSRPLSPRARTRTRLRAAAARARCESLMGPGDTSTLS